ncbi:MAG: helicase-exonuclease AddAB subunit AddB [Firmicutes bacterium]|jgi:ATP-dependent helicase/nuclease subunit B|nr:helicase-exonuclease AddAB subunit AddB [Bacillota bacterium]
MSVRFILGRAGTGKTRACLNNIREALIEDPSGPPVILLVPDQATFQMEHMLINMPDLPGFARAQVLSFKRLAARVLTELGGGGRKHIKELGKAMALRSLVQENADSLRLFASASRQYGFASCLSSTLKELSQYNISRLDLENAMDELERQGMGDLPVTLKLHDLIIVAEAYREYLSDRYLDPDEYLTSAALRISKSRLVRAATIWVDGFRGFTPQEYSVLGALLVEAEKVNIALLLDPEEASRPLREIDLFHPTWETYDYLLKLAHELNVEIEPALILDGKDAPKRAPALCHLEKESASRPPKPFPGVPHGFKLVACANPRAETEAVAVEILRLAREDGMRFRDIGVIVPALDEYHDLIAPIFKDYGIPCFIDRRRPVSHHPLIELIRSALEIASYGFRQEPVFRYLKTDLIPVGRREVDILENYVLAHGIQGALWADENPWVFRRVYGLGEPEEAVPGDGEAQGSIDDIRRRATRDLLTFYHKMQGLGISVRDMATFLFELLMNLAVSNQLDKWREECIDSGNPEGARENEQVWNAIVNLLDEVVQVLGDKEISSKEFQEIIEAGLESLTLGLIPPALDQVIVGSTDRSRHPPLRAAFLMGATYDSFPRRAPEDTILTDRDRQQLGEFNLALAPDSRLLQFHEQYNVYVALTRAWDFLMISYPLADGEGKAKRPSQVIGQLRDLFPELGEEFKGMGLPAPGEEALDTITSEKKASALLSRVFQRRHRGQAIDGFWLDVYEWLVSEPGRRRDAGFILGSLGFKNDAGILNKSAVDSFFQGTLRTSVTRLERFASCPFAHFAGDILGLTERALYKLEPPGMGMFMHEAMGVLFSRLDDSRQLAKMGPDEIATFVGGIVEELAPELQNEILMSSARYRYMTRVLRRILRNSVTALAEHERHSLFRPVGHEIIFGGPGDLPALTLKLDTGGQVAVRGRIDRVDIAESQGEWYLRVIDYKSRAHRLRLSDVYYGLALQLLVYLLAAMENRERLTRAKAYPAGALYFPMTDPIISAKGPLDDDKLEKQRMKRLRMSGLIVGDADVIRLMDSQVEAGEQSNLVAAGVTKTGRPSRGLGACVVEPEQYEVLSRFLKDKLKELAQSIQRGEIGIKPYKQGTARACAFCSYKPVCAFDILVEGNRYRLQRRLKDEEFWSIIQDPGCVSGEEGEKA